MATTIELKGNKRKCFGGEVRFYTHNSDTVKCNMTFAVYLPPQAFADSEAKLPVLYWLSGLTCSEQNFITKAGGYRAAAKHGIILVCPDTSPRGCGIEGEDDDWDFGSGAGFYVDAETEKYKKNYNMFSYISFELPSVINSNFSTCPEKISIFGHSMGGHGALVCALKNPGLYKSISAFAPICNPINCQWGKKAFSGYLGDDTEQWKEWDACCLAEKYAGPKISILIDQGSEDCFLKPDLQLLPENFEKVVATKCDTIDSTVRYQAGYDHSYYFIATFVDDHINHHAKYLI